MESIRGKVTREEHHGERGRYLWAPFCVQGRGEELGGESGYFPLALKEEASTRKGRNFSIQGIAEKGSWNPDQKRPKAITRKEKEKRGSTHS